MDDELWQAFMKWAKEQERVTYYFSSDDSTWTVEWFDQKGSFHYKDGDKLSTLIESII